MSKSQIQEEIGVTAQATDPTAAAVQGKAKRFCKLEWPDGQDSARRSTDCERGRGCDYGQLRIHNSRIAAFKKHRKQLPITTALHPESMPSLPDPGPLSHLSVAIVGFQRDHEVTNGTVNTNNWCPVCIPCLDFVKCLRHPTIGIVSPKERMHQNLHSCTTSVCERDSAVYTAASLESCSIRQPAHCLSCGRSFWF